MLRLFRLQEGWLTVGLLALMLFSVTLSIQQAQWSDGLSILTPITLIGLATGIVLAKVRGVPRFLLDLIGLEIGLITVLLAVASVMQDPRLVTVQDHVQDLLARTATWLGVALRNDMSDDLVVFILSLAVVCWVLAYSSAYFVFKSRQLWWALIPNGIALLINLSYSIINLNGYIIVFMFSALLLMIRFNLLIKEERWQRERVNYSPGLTWAFLWAGSAISIVLASAMWFVPATAVNGTLNNMWERVNKPWVDLQDSMSRLWARVDGNQSVGGYSSFKDSFTMGGSLNLSNAPAMIVRSSQPLYWRANTYDQYNGQGWDNTAKSTFHVSNLNPMLALEANQQLISADTARKEVSYTVQLLSPKEDNVFASLRPLRLDIATRLEVSWRTLNEQYSIDQICPQEGGCTTESVPLELRLLVGQLHQAEEELRASAGAITPAASPAETLYSTSKGADIRQQVDDLSKRGVNVVLRGASAPNYDVTLLATGEVPVYDDITAIRATGPLPRNSQYSAVSLVSNATPDQLRAAGTAYETWVTDRYLSRPATLPQRVQDLAQSIVDSANATNPYDEGKAIESYLRTTYAYNTNIGQPPSGVDLLDWFLFTKKEGYCEYYAGAMTMMMRSLGIPTRLASGYAPGSYDAKTGAYIVRESSAHAWPEVYFPGYGWIQFEPTPSQAVITTEVQGTPAPAVPTPDLTPAATPSPNTPRDQGLSGAIKPSNNGGSGPLSGVPFGIIGGLVALAAVVVALTLWAPVPWRKRRSAAAAGFYYGKMLWWARLLRISPALYQTPYEFSESLAREVPGTSLFTRTIARAYVRERFGRGMLQPDEKSSAYRAWASLRGRLLRTMPARQFGRVRLRSRRRRNYEL